MSRRLVALTAMLALAGCKKPKPPAPAPAPTAHAPKVVERAPLQPVHLTAADLHLADGGRAFQPEQPSIALAAPKEQAPDTEARMRKAFAETPLTEDEGELPADLDAGPARPRACAPRGSGFTCSAACWCHRDSQATVADLRAACASDDHLWLAGGPALLWGDRARWLGILDPPAAHLDWPAATSSIDPPSGLLAVSGAGGHVWVANASEIYELDGRAWHQTEDGQHHANAIAALYAADASHQWTAGRGGELLEGDGRSWTTAESPTVEQLYGIHGSGPRDVWAVGANATVLHFDGSAWRTVKAPAPADVALLGVFARAPDDVWISGDRGVLLHGGRSGFQLVPSGTEYGLFAVVATDSDVFAAGRYGALVHRSGSGPFAPEASDVAVDLRALALVGGRLFAAGDTGVILWKDL